MAGSKFTTTDGHFELMPAEVKEIIYSPDNPNLLYAIKVSILDAGEVVSDNTNSFTTAIPLNTNIIRIPVVGEVVLICKSTGAGASGTSNATSIYYLDIISLQSNIHHNGLPTVVNLKVEKVTADGDSKKYNETSSGNVNKEVSPELDTNFVENSNVKPLQHYVGDVLFLGRYGNSLRFSTTPKSGKFAINPKWSGGNNSDPVTILRTTRQNVPTKRFNEFTTEDFTKDDNIFVQASGQKIEFEQSSKVLKSANSKSITSWKDENWGTTPQTLISSGRIIFNSTQKEIIAFAKNGIALSSETSVTVDGKDNVSINATKIELGTDANEQIILGNAWKSWMDEFIQTLSTITVPTPAGIAGPLTSAPQWPQIESLKARLDTLLSGIAFTKK